MGGHNFPTDDMGWRETIEEPVPLSRYQPISHRPPAITIHPAFYAVAFAALFCVAVAVYVTITLAAFRVGFDH